jgi:3-deoxy-D-manno-octulosonic-acid transferase
MRNVTWSWLVYLLLPYVALGLIWRGIRYRPYLQGWGERFGFVERRADRRLIWVHAVSVGEVRSAAPLVRALEARYPRHEILVTTMTPTGADQVKLLFDGRVRHSYLPYDFPDAVARFLDRVRPDFAVIAETEFWPNLYAACERRRIPLMLVSVRVSLASLTGYLKVPQTTRSMLLKADLICAQTRTDAQRLRNLGVPDTRLHITGNLKFDFGVPLNLLELAAELRSGWGDGRPIWVAGSTHAGEEKKILDVHAALRRRWPHLLLVLVPRNPERFNSVARLCRRRGFSIALRSRSMGPLGLDTEVLIGDTMGELQLLYAASDVAFVGGSLVKRGGQNILEPCAVGKPVLFGPHMFHFEDISAMALDCGAGSQVYDGGELEARVALYLGHPNLRIAAGHAARRLVEENRGSLDQTLALMTRRLSQIANGELATTGAEAEGIEYP